MACMSFSLSLWGFSFSTLFSGLIEISGTLFSGTLFSGFFTISSGLIIIGEGDRGGVGSGLF